MPVIQEHGEFIVERQITNAERKAIIARNLRLIHAGEVKISEGTRKANRRTWWLRYTRMFWEAEDIYRTESDIFDCQLFPDFPRPDIVKIRRWHRTRAAQNAADRAFVTQNAPKHRQANIAYLLRRIA